MSPCTLIIFIFVCYFNLNTSVHNAFHLILSKTLQAVCKSLKLLQTLNLNGCSAVSDIGLAGHGLGQKEPSVNGTGLSLEALGLKEKGMSFQCTTVHYTFTVQTPSCITVLYYNIFILMSPTDPFKVQLGSKAEQVIRQEAEVKKYLLANMDEIINSSEFGLSNLTGVCCCFRTVHKFFLCHLNCVIIQSK